MFSMIDSFNNAAIAAELNSLCEQLNEVNDRYSRYCGTLYMACADTENKIEDILNDIDEAKEHLSNLTDEQIADFTDDVQAYRSFLERLTVVVDTNRQEIAKAREFLARYKAE